MERYRWEQAMDLVKKYINTFWRCVFVLSSVVQYFLGYFSFWYISNRNCTKMKNIPSKAIALGGVRITLSLRLAHRHTK